jgi:hypothetical protein
MKNKIKCIFDDGNQFKQYYKTGWQCGVGDDDVPMTIVVEVINMLDAAGEKEYENYNYVFSIGLLNKNIHKTVLDGVADGDDFVPGVYDIAGHYGLNCYVDQQLLDMDMINKNLMGELKITDACTADYKCRFTGKTKQTLHFKTDDAAFSFAEKLINNYGDVIMTLIGFTLDRPINLAGNTGWEQTELFHNGLNKKKKAM